MILKTYVRVGSAYNGIEKRNPATGGYSSRKYRGRRAHVRIRDILAKAGAGYQHDISQVKNSNAGKVVGYITKYMTKELGKIKLPKNSRRIEMSQGFIGFTNWQSDNDIEWQVTDYFQHEDYARDSADGIRWYDADRKVEVTQSQFDKTGYPPENEKREGS